MTEVERRDIGDYSRDELVEALRVTLGGEWTPREDAVRQAARHLGFQRVGSRIRDAFKSALNGAIRRGVVECDPRDRDRIRRAKG